MSPSGKQVSRGTFDIKNLSLKERKELFIESMKKDQLEFSKRNQLINSEIIFGSKEDAKSSRIVSS
jgi:hypothetical protein